MEKRKINIPFLIGLILSLAVFVGSVIMVAYSAKIAGGSSDLGVDPNDGITKMYTDDETIKIAGNQKGEIYAVDMDGETLWNVGALYSRALYDITKRGDVVYALYANGNVVSFNVNDAASFTPKKVAEGDETPSGEEFLAKCAVYETGGINAQGNVSNSQLLLSEDGKTLFVRGIFSARNLNNRIYAFDLESGERKTVKQSAGKIGGSGVTGGKLYFANGNAIGVYDGAGTTDLALSGTIEESIVSLSCGDGYVSAIGENSTIYKIDLTSGNTVSSASLGITLNTSFVYSTGKNFVAKIQNGGVAMIDAGSMKVTLNMKAEDKANLIMWSENGFALRDESDITNTNVIYYNAADAHAKVLYTRLRTVFAIVMILAVFVSLYFGFGLSATYRQKINAKAIAFFRALYKYRLVYISLIIPFVLLTLFYYIPIVFGFRLAFYDYVPGVKDSFVGWANFRAVVKTAEFWSSAKTMLVVLLADLLKALIPPIILAELIVAVRCKQFSLWTRILLFLPGVLPGVATVLVWQSGVFGATQNSLVNALIGVFVPGFVKNWVYSASNATAVGTLIAFGFPWIGSYLIFYGAITGINVSYFEAAKLDGCSWWKRIVKIDIPLIVPQIKYIFVTSFIASVQNYTSIFVIHGVDGQIKTPALLMYREIVNANYGIASVMGIIIFLFLSVATFFNFRMQSDNS